MIKKLIDFVASIGIETKEKNPMKLLEMIEEKFTDMAQSIEVLESEKAELETRLGTTESLLRKEK